MNLGGRPLNLLQQAPHLGRILPLVRAEIRHNVDLAALAACQTDQLFRQQQRRPGTGRQFGDLERIAFGLQRHVEFRVDDLGVEVQYLVVIHALLEFGGNARGAGEADQREFLRAALGRDGRASPNSLDRRQPALERAGAAQSIGHRVTVVQQDVMMSRLAAQQIQPLPARDPLGQHGHCQGDGRHPHQQQDQLLEPNPLAMLLVALQQELHRRPFHPTVPHHVDQVDQQRHEHQEKAPGQGLMDELHGDLAFSGQLSAVSDEWTSSGGGFVADR